MNEPDIMTRLEAASKKPLEKESIALFNKIIPSLHTTGAETDFGPVQRAAAVSKLHAMVQTLGLPSYYLTLVRS